MSPDHFVCPSNTGEGIMSAIVCAIRGGPDSQPTIAKSIELAKETGLTLYFMYVVNLDFLTHTSSSRTHTLSEQMHQMGEFILLSAQSKAAADNVAAEGVIRQGQVREEIAALCHEVDATYLVIGQPKGQEEGGLFTHEMLQKFIERIEQETGAKVVMPDEASE
jgi:nucleotide-binding universal stress UspA family protein